MENNNIYYVYLHRRNDTNDVFYVGKGKNNRAKVKRRNKWWLNIANKHGYTIEYVEKGLSEESALDLEVEIIKFYKECGYQLVNMTDGGEGTSGWIPSDDTKEKISNSHKGKVFSDEHRNNISLAKKGIPLSEEHRLRQSAGKTGLKASKEARAKRGKKVYCSNGMSFPAASFAAEWLKTIGFEKADATAIRKCCRCNGVNHTAYGFSWNNSGDFTPPVCLD